MKFFTGGKFQPSAEYRGVDAGTGGDDIGGSRPLQEYAAVFLAALAQGYCARLVYLGGSSPTALLSVYLLPLPLYLVGRIGRGGLLRMVPWCAALLAIDWWWASTASPYAGYRSDMLLLMAGWVGFVMMLPYQISWMEGRGFLPDWGVIFSRCSRAFFSFGITVVTIGIFYIALNLGAEMLDRVGIHFVVELLRDEIFVVIFFYPAFALTLSWCGAQRRLMDILTRNVLPIVSCLLPLMSLLSLIFFAALPMGVEALWERGFDSGLVLAIYMMNGLLVFSAWRDGVNADGSLREPFGIVNRFVKCVVFLLPVYGILLCYTIGLRVSQYSWTVDRLLAFVAALVLTIWTLLWSGAMIKGWRSWPRSYGEINRLAFPAVALILVLLVSPLADARKIVAARRMAWLYNLSRTEPQRIVTDFNWSYMLSELGSYGAGVVEALEGEEGAAAFKRRLELDGQSNVAAGDILRDAYADLEAKRKRALYSTETHEDWERRRALDKEQLAELAASAPVFGGELSAQSRRDLAPQLDVYLRDVEPDGERAFFLFEDLDGDGDDELMFCMDARVIVLDRSERGHPFELRRSDRLRSEGSLSPIDAARAGDYGTEPMKWRLFQIGGRTFKVPPDRYYLDE